MKRATTVSFLLASALLIPHIPVCNGANVTAMDHYRERNAFTENPRDGFVQPSHPYRLSGVELRIEPSHRIPNGTTPHDAEPHGIAWEQGIFWIGNFDLSKFCTQLVDDRVVAVGQAG